MDIDSERVDEAVEDPPVTWVVSAAVGLGLAGVGLVAFVLGLAGVGTNVVDLVPALGVVFESSAVLFLVGVGLFVASMTRWENAVDS